MERYSPQERGIIVSILLRNNSSVVLAQREFRRRFPGRPTPTAQTLRRLATNLEEYGTTRDVAKSGRPRSARSAKNIAAVAEDVELSPETSTRRRATQLAISRTSLRRILGELSKPLSWSIPADKICEKLKKKDAQICDLRFDKQIDLNNVDLKKLKVRDLKKILNDWDEVCDGCIEKTDFIKRIEELKPKYMGSG